MGLHSGLTHAGFSDLMGLLGGLSYKVFFGVLGLLGGLSNIGVFGVLGVPGALETLLVGAGVALLTLSMLILLLTGLKIRLGGAFDTACGEVVEPFEEAFLGVLARLNGGGGRPIKVGLNWLVVGLESEIFDRLMGDRLVDVRLAVDL